MVILHQLTTNKIVLDEELLSEIRVYVAKHMVDCESQIELYDHVLPCTTTTCSRLLRELSGERETHALTTRFQEKAEAMARDIAEMVACKTPLDRSFLRMVIAPWCMDEIKKTVEDLLNIQ